MKYFRIWWKRSLLRSSTEPTIRRTIAKMKCVKNKAAKMSTTPFYKRKQQYAFCMENCIQINVFTSFVVTLWKSAIICFRLRWDKCEVQFFWRVSCLSKLTLGIEWLPNRIWNSRKSRGTNHCCYLSLLWQIFLNYQMQQIQLSPRSSSLESSCLKFKT